MPVNADDDIQKILRQDTIAVVGCSASPGKAAHDVPKYLREQGYKIVPVNPHADRVFGEKAYDSLADVDETVDVVNVFRPSDEVPGIVDEALDREDVDAVWLQLGITHDAAGDRVEDAGKQFVQDKCLKVEHQRLT